jgi:hypothetical protein
LLTPTLAADGSGLGGQPPQYPPAVIPSTELAVEVGAGDMRAFG